ncbi:ATP synthase subunit H-domain-containing protein [Limtongia smithiae]|uniref:ATP synthase subunit H-domain-containing protein n=1 Tax=Limtongia smithiae TaxID=1125753 RepID=UPI0034CE0CA1
MCIRTNLCLFYSAEVLYVLAAVIGLCLGTWFLTPKGDNQTVWRSSIILTLSMCYIMWALTYLSQLHPLIQPMRSDLRPEFAEGYAEYEGYY